MNPLKESKKLTSLEKTILNSFFTEYDYEGSLQSVFDDIEQGNSNTVPYFVFEDWDKEFLISHIASLHEDLLQTLTGLPNNCNQADKK